MLFKADRAHHVTCDVEPSTMWWIGCIRSGWKGRRLCGSDLVIVSNGHRFAATSSCVQGTLIPLARRQVFRTN
jgi:hypothetical protein